MNRKGFIDIKYLVMIILMLSILWVFSSFLVKYEEKFESVAYDEACNQYIKLHLFGKKGFLDVSRDYFPCKTEDVTIKSNKSLDIMKQTATNMATCTTTFSLHI